MITLQFIGRFPEQDRLEDFAIDVMNHFFSSRPQEECLSGHSDREEPRGERRRNMC